MIFNPSPEGLSSTFPKTVWHQLPETRTYFLKLPNGFVDGVKLDFSRVRNLSFIQKVFGQYRRHIKPHVFAVFMHPDRAIGITALFIAILAVVPGVLAKGNHVSVIVVILSSLLLGLIFTLPSLKLSPNRYCRVILASDPEMEFVFQRLILNSERALKRTLISLDVTPVSNQLVIIEALKREVAERLGIDNNALCDIVLGFNPNMVRRRITKLQENKIELLGVGTQERKIQNPEEVKKYSRNQRIDLQNKQIVEYLERGLRNLQELKELPISWSEFAKFCRSPSSSSALIRYQMLLADVTSNCKSSSELDSHVRKLYQLQNIVQGTSAHALLHGVNEYSELSGYYVSEADIQLRRRLLRLPLGDLDSNLGSDNTAWWKNLAFDKRRWITDASNIVMESRTELYDQFESDVNYHSGGRTMYLVVDGYSRAVRLMLKLSIDVIANTEIIFLSYGDRRRDLGLEQMAHEITYEPSIAKDLNSWLKKCKNRIHFATSDSILRFTQATEGGHDPRFLFLVGTGGVISSIDNEAHTIRRGRSQKDLIRVQKRLKRQTRRKPRSLAIAGGYKHKDVLGRFWHDSSSSILSSKKTYLWEVDKVITGKRAV